MRRQLKLQGQLTGPYVNTDNDETSEKASRSLRQQTHTSDGEHCERRQEGDVNSPWTKAAGAVPSANVQPVTQRSGKWERPEGLSSEELRSSSIAALRAKAREHEAEIHSTINMSGGDTQSQTQEADATHDDWSSSFFLFVKIIITKHCVPLLHWNIHTLWDEELYYLAIIK